jgi:hypothetical protein
MAAATKSSFFKQGGAGRDKAENTTSIARSIADAEAAARVAKTERLKKLRLEKEAADRAAAAAQPAAPKPVKGKRKQAV